MKLKPAFYLFILCLGVFAHAQDRKFSTTLGYPIAVGDNFLKSYTGIIDVGAQVRFLKAGPVHIGISGNANFFNRNNTLSTFSYKEQVILVQPRVFGELNSKVLLGFRPFLGAGYSFMTSKFKANSNQTPDSSDNTGGVNINIGSAYDITNRFFVFVSFDYINVSRDNPNIDNSFFNIANILKFGAGIRF
ncbi:outer membrane beta-barrel protein [Maribacter aurantiacus]|uniref:Porin family protein n=1 Tax=Maribacter aurantiacus TaxID=1882343 RepID=A0A5R8MA67_9FLAO|nr:outer membrane beta-barrel protein [Maribacter aurantiacus]TLF46454.1 porin family protein [Maribacter aurantiacus]